MKRIFKTAAIALICGAMMAPATEAQTRGRNNAQTKPSSAQTRPSTNQSTSRPGNNSAVNNRPTGGVQPGGQRPGNQGGMQPGVQPGGQRPGNQGGMQPGNNTGQRPGNQPGVQPGNNGQRPGDMGGMRPGNQGNRPGNQPSFGGQRPNYHPAPPTPGPMRPGPGYAPQPWYRPAPPAAWRPPTVWRPFGSILGVSLGSSINFSLNILLGNGYRATQVGNNTVNAYNVPMLNYIWPNAVLYYNNYGGLCGSRFIYSTGYYDMSRYNSVYATLVNSYGSPYSVQNNASGIVASWWGPNNQYISLAFEPQYMPTGAVGYYTTLSFGN